MWVVFTEARRVLALRIETEGPSPDAHPGTPLIVACRHAGPGDSFTLIHALMDWYDREPRVVLKDTMAWDPVVDVVLQPAARPASSRPTPGRARTSSRRSPTLARGLDENDAFVIFPEGGNFTPERRRRGIERLRRRGLDRMADRAARMTHVLAPRPGGFLAALDAAPDADVVLVAHTGLDHMLTVARRVARAADGQGDRDAVVAGAARGDPRRARGADRVAVRLVGADRRLDSGEPAAGSLPRPVPAYCCGVLSGQALADDGFSSPRPRPPRPARPGW